MRRRNLALPVAFALVAIPGGLAAQACIGIPVAESRNVVSAQVGFPEGAMSYGAAVRHNMAGPLSLGAQYSLSSFDNVDPKLHGFGVDAAYELPNQSFSGCSVTGLGYSRMSSDGVTLSTLSIPVGVGLGKSLQVSDRMSLIPHVVPQWVWTRAKISADGESLSGDDSVWAAAFGATLATPRFYVGGRLMWVNESDVDPVFSIMAGLPF